MARLLVVTLALVLALPGSTMARDGEWPTADEVRRELQSIGYDFGSDEFVWEGGRESMLQATFADDPEPAIRLLEGDTGLTIRFLIPADQLMAALLGAREGETRRGPP
jgi:hypothetical protein